jgi:hypothetical protein
VGDRIVREDAVVEVRDDCFDGLTAADASVE